MESFQTLRGMLNTYRESGVYPMHMPGHKRRANPCCPEFPWGWDVTEVDDFDNLHRPQGVLRRIEEEAAALFGSDRAWLLVNGSTAGILAAIAACAGRGEKILAARNCHRSVFHTVEILGLSPVWLPPEQGPFPFCGQLAPKTVQRALAAHPDARAVVVTSPTYDGIGSDLASMAQLCRRAGALLVVDAAHGAHLGLGGPFSPGAVAAGADLAVMSLHKTLPAPTQTALLHCCGGRVDRALVSHFLDVFQTSSPSYPLMAGAEGCLRLLRREGGALLEAWGLRLERFAEACRRLRRLRLLDWAALQTAPGFAFDSDPGKLLIDCGAAQIDGPSLARRLREEYRIAVEMAQPSYLLAMTSPMDTDEGLARLARALLEIDGTLAGRQPEPPPLFRMPETVLPLDRALRAPFETVAWAQAEGRTSAGWLMAYPPGIPWLLPGERIGADCVAALRRAEESGLALIGDGRGGAGRLAVIKESPNA